MTNESNNNERGTRNNGSTGPTGPTGPTRSTDPNGPAGPQPRKGMPDWGKWLIGCLVAFVSAAVLLFSTCAYMIRNGF